MTQLHPAIADAEAVLFDFDFTLADSSVGIIECIGYALDRMGLPKSPNDRILKTVGLYLPEALVALHGEEARQRGQEFLALFTERADEVMTDGTYFFPVTPAVLRAVDSIDVPIAIVSTKYRYRIEAILSRDGLLDCVDVIVGGEDVTSHKPDPEGLFTAARRLGVPVDRCVYVGDSEVDARAACCAGMPFVAVTTGTTRAKDLSRYPNLYVLPDVGHLIYAAF